jgi:5'-nucleotidase
MKFNHSVLSIFSISIALLAACAPMLDGTPNIATPVDVSILAFNDFHGNLEPPHIAIREQIANEAKDVPAGGAAYLAAAIQHFKKQNPLNAVVSAGDMIGASPLVSALFLDEPTIEVVNAMGIDFNAVGNHEFDKGTDELLRMRHGGCAKFTRLEPCQVNRQFPGANFEFLAANVQKTDKTSLFPAYGIKSFQSGKHTIKIGFIGMTLKGTPKMVTPDGIKGLSFEDEAQTANKLVPVLKAQGVSALVLVIHEGGVIKGHHNDANCPGLSGDIVPILNQLDSAFDVVVSGHTHRAYACEFNRINPSKPFLLTSAGQYGTLLTHIQLKIDPVAKTVLNKSAYNNIVQSEAFIGVSGLRVQPVESIPSYGKDKSVEKILLDYQHASQGQVQKVIGNLPESLIRKYSPSGESPLGNLVADAQWYSTASKERGASDFALMNPGGIRADISVPLGGGTVNFGQIFKVQPFGNTLTVKNMSGKQIKELLEFQFNLIERPKVLFPSSNLRYSVDLRQAQGQRISNVTVNGQILEATRFYRVTVNSFIASGGDGFWHFNEAPTISGGELDVDALAEYIRARPGLQTPLLNRIQML